MQSQNLRVLQHPTAEMSSQRIHITSLFSCAGHTTQITCISITSRGHMLASGGIDLPLSLDAQFWLSSALDNSGFLIVWDMATGDQLYENEDVFGGPISALTWIEGSSTSEDSQHPNLCFGNSAGHLVVCSFDQREVRILVLIRRLSKKLIFP